MAPHLSPVEQRTILKAIYKKGKTKADALRAVNVLREKKGMVATSRSSIHRFTTGVTHRHNTKEKRGRKKILKKSHTRKLDRSRLKLIREADSEWPVTYKAVMEDAGMTGMVCQRTVEDEFRAAGVSFRTPRSKVFLSEKDASKRFKTAKEWIKRPASFWSTKIHGYFDCKAFPLPLNATQRKKYRQARVKGHLRKASEGASRSFTKVRTKHSFLGVPSATIAALVAKDKVIMWHVISGPWNGSAAAQMYAGPMKKALVKTWGVKAKYTIIEDGDRKGNQSGKGIKAKADAKIHAMTLPPRTPSWMPLDYTIWNEIEKYFGESAPSGDESKAAFLERLEQCAKNLPRPFVVAALAKMKRNIQGVIDARGFHAKND